MAEGIFHLRIIQVRRHSMRAPAGQHLSQEGVTLARRVGETLGHFDRVINEPIAARI